MHICSQLRFKPAGRTDQCGWHIAHKIMWKICHERSRLNIRKESFPNRAVNMWNVLPEHVVNASSVDSFKNRLDKQWGNEEIVYDYKAAAPAGRKIFAPAGTQDLTIEAKACGHEDT